MWIMIFLHINFMSLLLIMIFLCINFMSLLNFTKIDVFNSYIVN